MDNLKFTCIYNTLPDRSSRPMC